MSKLKQFKLNEIAVKDRGLIDGPFGSNLPASDYIYSGVPVIRGCNLSLGKQKFVDKGYIFVSEKTAKKLERSKCIKGDIIFTKKGTLGQIGIIPENSKYETYILSSNQMKLSVNKHVADNLYVYYYLSSKNTIEKIRRESESTGVPKINLGYLKNFEVALPNLEIQTRIASILSSLDDKIELNRRMNQTLEQMAQALFNHYFVDNIDLENLPEGWRWGKLSEMYKTTSGGTPSRGKDEYYLGGDIPWVKSKELNNGFILHTEEKITDDGLKNSSAKLLPIHSVLVAMYGATVGEITTLSIRATCNQAICAILPNKDYPYSFIFQFLKENKQELINRASGSAQQNISQIVIQNFELAIPPSSVIDAFHQAANNLYLRIESNLKENKSLAELRDTLLPKLMSGEIDVDELISEARIAEEEVIVDQADLITAMV